VVSSAKISAKNIYQPGVDEEITTLVDSFLTPAEVAAWLKISTTMVYALCDAGEIVCHRIGLGKKRKRIRIAAAAVDAYLERTEAGPRAVLQMPQESGEQKRGGGGKNQPGVGYSRLRSLGWKG
jgi:excisionase family DNA binding protein